LGAIPFIERDVFKGDIMIVTSNFSTVISLIRGFTAVVVITIFPPNSCPLIANNWSWWY
jgi:hypothetical protein